MTNATLNGKPKAGNPHVWFDERDVALAKPRHGSLLYRTAKLLTSTRYLVAAFFTVQVLCVAAKGFDTVPTSTMLTLPDIKTERATDVNSLDSLLSLTVTCSRLAA